MLRTIIIAVIMAMPLGVLAIETISSEVPDKQFLGQELVTDSIKARIAEDQSLAFNVVTQGLADFPDEVVAIVISAMQSGASTIDIARQCDTDIPARLVPGLVYAAISQGGDPELMIAKCLCAVPVDQAHVVFMAAMQNIDATQAEGLLATAMQAFEDCDSANCARPSSADQAHVVSIAATQNIDATQAEGHLATAMQALENCVDAGDITPFDQTLNMLVAAMKNAESIQLKTLVLDITIKMISSNGTDGSTTVFDGYLSTLLLAGMQGNNSPEIDRLLDLALQTFEGNGMDGSAILVDALVQGDFLSYANTSGDCTAECTRPLAQGLVNQKVLPTQAVLSMKPDPTGVSATATATDVVEPPASGS